MYPPFPDWSPLPAIALSNDIAVVTAHPGRHFHGDERCIPPPSYIHVLDALYEMGIYASVELINAPPSLQFHYSSLDAAVEGLFGAIDLAR